MIYLKNFRFPDKERELDYRISFRMTCYNTMYPFFVLSERGLTSLDFEPITILYGGNGSGKTTALNIIAEKVGAQRDARYNRSEFFENYTKLCCFEQEDFPQEKKFLASDDVFDFMLNVRAFNEGAEENVKELSEAYIPLRENKFTVRSLEDYEQLKQICDARRLTESKFISKYRIENIRERSNGESAFSYFTQKIKNNGLYLLDEPENSLSPERQTELARFLVDSARFYNCQFIIATHSPFLLAMRGAKIYDLDEEFADVKQWHQLKNVREYYNFFKKHEEDFK